MSEMNIRECKKCKVSKQRIEDGKYPNGKNKKYRDESGKLWSGNTCADCNNQRAKEIMRNLRTAKLIVEG